MWFGSLSGCRFLNHSCEPNLIAAEMPVVGVNGEKRWLVIMYAVRHIQPGNELTLDYNPMLSREDMASDSGHKPCLCGAEKCRGWMVS